MRLEIMAVTQKADSSLRSEKQFFLARYRFPRRSAHAGEFAEAFHFGAGGHGAVLLHHGAHL
jgi:hypothetical protein